jgi:putative oxidoreductase
VDRNENTRSAMHTWNSQAASQFAPCVLRLVLGLIFLVHGLIKFAHMANSIASFAKIGVPLPGLAAPVIAILEVLGGLVLILGLGWATRVVAFLLAIEMLVAILLVKLRSGFVGGYEYELLLLAALLALVFSGPGRWALMRERIQAW